MLHSSSSTRNSNMPYSRLHNDESEISDSSDTSPASSLLPPGRSDLSKYSQIIKGSLVDEVYQAIGYKRFIPFIFLFYLFGFLSFGFIYLLAYWKPEWKVIWTKRRSSLQLADTLILTDLDGVTHVVTVHIQKVEGNIPQEYNFPNEKSNGKSEIHFFVLQYLKYIWNVEAREYKCLIGLGNDTLVSSLLKDFRGYSYEEQATRECLFGKNCISVEVKSYLRLLFSEVLNPFYVFQIASLILWSSDEYYLYAFCIFFISCLSIGVALFETRKQSENLKSMVESSNANHVLVLRSPEMLKPVEVDALCVVPGDVIVIPSCGGVMGCDAVLISGNVIVNESMLTGESVPVTKTPLTLSEEEETYSPEKHKRHTLFCGTNVIQTRYYGKEQVLAIVVRTGFSTAKGELVRSILYPRPIDFKFYKDSIKFIGFLFVVSVFGMGYCVYIYMRNQKPVLETIIRALDIITIVVPPALPAAMTVGTYYAQSRLKKLGIFCISPPRINLCGKLKLVCFDKTGTLTEDGLEVWGVVGVQNNLVGGGGIELGSPCHQVDLLEMRDPLLTSLATCHSLTFIKGEITGDPLDIQMFDATKWELVEPGQESEIFDSLIPSLVRPRHRPLISPLNPSRDEIDSGPVFPPQDPVEGIAPLVPGVGGEPDVGEGGENKEGKVQSLTIEQDTALSRSMETSFLCVVRPRGTASPAITAAPDLIGLAETSFQVPYEIGIVRQFPFSSSMQRMSVIVRVLGNPHMELYCKGAPEVIQLLCKPETIPKNLSSILTRFTLRGFRVIALAHRDLDPKMSWHNAQRAKRKQVECDLTFLGLLILQNVLKAETSPVIEQLKESNIRTVMVTGDNILTGICVARDCGMVSMNETVLLANLTVEDGRASLSFEPAHSGGLTDSLEPSQDKHYVSVSLDEKYSLAVTGSVWGQVKEWFPEVVPWVVSEGTVFARMSPDQKVQLVEELMELDYMVGMCGDGANDCGALKAAHVGISLSEAEASVAAPFTSRVPNIRCVPQVICEGRGALATNFSVFKYMALYSIIQFVSVLILYSVCTNLSDPQFLYIDLFIVTTIAIFMGYTKANHKLVAKRPLSNLIGFVNLFSVSVQIFLVIATQVGAYLYLKMQPWYSLPTSQCVGPDTDDMVLTWETNAIFCVSSFQYMSLGVIYSSGRPFREPLYSNVCLMVTLLCLCFSSLWLLMWPPPIVASFMQLKPFPGQMPFLFRGTLLAIVALHFFLGWCLEYYLAGSVTLKKAFKWLSRKKQPKNLYKRVQAQVVQMPNWPPTASNPMYSSRRLS